MTSPLRPLIDLDATLNRRLESYRGKRSLGIPLGWLSTAAEFSALWVVLGLGITVSTKSSWGFFFHFGLTLFVESLLVNQVLKRIFRRQRPALSSLLIGHVRRPTTTSFPSGHASSSAVALVFLTAMAPWAFPLWLILCCAVVFSRLYYCMHYASDVLGGFTLGLIVALASMLIV